MITKENKVFCDSEKEINFYKNQIEGLMIKIAEIQKENEKLKAKSRWISLREQMPENTEEVLVCTLSKNGSRNIDKGYRSFDRIIHRGRAEVTHWMPLPELPGEN